MKKKGSTDFNAHLEMKAGKVNVQNEYYRALSDTTNSVILLGKL